MNKTIGRADANENLEDEYLVLIVGYGLEMAANNVINVL
jgi:hypothetical protein